LVLSPDAKANSIPNLEILCDDVICGHGSSVGPLEEEHLYYLGSRGISPQRAERLLVRGFFQEVLDRLPVSGMEGALAEILERRFIRGQQSMAEQ
jgi:Fe-S cluster assembly scaffold protein SufB